MEIRQLERRLAADYAKVIKASTGRGPLDCKVRIVDSVIIFRSRLDFTMLEQTMFSQLKISGVVDAMLDQWAEQLMPILTKMVEPLRHGVQIQQIQLSSGIPNSYCVCVCHLNMDLEKMILTEPSLAGGVPAQREAFH